MLKKDIKIRSSEGPQFDCYLVTPEDGPKVPAIVLASAIHGVDQDLRGIADEFGARGYIAAAPDLFWRTVPGPLARDDQRAAPRGQPRRAASRASTRSGPASATSPTCCRCCGASRSSTAAPR